LARASANAAQRRTHAARWQSRAEAPPGSSAWAEVGGLCCLPHAAPIGLRAVDADFDGISVEGHIAKLALAGVVIAHDTCVEDRHQGHGSGALAALRALRGTHAAGPAWGGWGAGWRHWLPPQRDAGDFNFQLGFRTEHRGSSTPEVSFATPISSFYYYKLPIQIADGLDAGIVARGRHPREKANAVDRAATGLGRCIRAIVAARLDELAGEPDRVGKEGAEALRGRELKPGADGAGV
jgi:hypothetical protein